MKVHSAGDYTDEGEDLEPEKEEEDEEQRDIVATYVNNLLKDAILNFSQAHEQSDLTRGSGSDSGSSPVQLQTTTLRRAESLELIPSRTGGSNRAWFQSRLGSNRTGGSNRLGRTRGVPRGGGDT